MNFVTLGDITIILTLIGSVFGLYHWFNKKVLGPLEKVEHFATVNGNADPKNPTLRDDLSTLKTGMEAQNALLTRHFAWSEEEISRIWAAIAKKVDK